MTGEVLDAAFRLFRAGLLRCLPYSGLAVLVLELPTLYSTFLTRRAVPVVRHVRTHLSQSCCIGVRCSSVALLGVITLRLNAVRAGVRPRFRAEIATALRRWPRGADRHARRLRLSAVAVWSAARCSTSMLPTAALLLVAVPLLWPTALFVVALPAFWCDGLGPFAAIAHAVRISLRRSWRMVGAMLATVCMVAVFYVLSADHASACCRRMLGRADLFLIATVQSMLSLVVGAFGVPFVLAVLIVAYEDLKLREQERRGARA